MTFLLFLLQLSAGTAWAQHLGKCAAHQSVALANGTCAYGHPEHKFGSWGDTTTKYGDMGSSETLPRVVPDLNVSKDKPKGELRILAVDARKRLVQVLSGNDLKIWVGADALACGDNPNVMAYKDKFFNFTRVACHLNNHDPVVEKMVKNLEDAHADVMSPILRKATEYFKKTLANAKADSRLVINEFASPQYSDDDRYKMLQDSYSRLIELKKRATAIYGNSCDGKVTAVPGKLIQEVQREKGERFCRTINDAAHYLEMVGINDPAKRKGVLEQVATMGMYANGNSWILPAELPLKTALYYGLPPQAQQSLTAGTAQGKLKFIERSKAFRTIEDETGKKFDATEPAELYNGYLYDGTGQPGDPTECAGFALHYVFGMSQPTIAGKQRSFPTVDSFDDLHRVITGELKGSVALEKYKDCFIAVNMRDGEIPMPGDIAASAGHVVIVEKFNPIATTIDTIEAASGNCGSVCRSARPLLEPSCGAPDDSSKTPLRSDLRILRFAPHGACTIKTDLR